MARGRHGEQSADTSFLPAANEEALQSGGCGPFATAGAGSEEHPSLTVSDYMSMFDEESPPEEYQSALLAGAGSEEQPSLTVSDYMSMFDEESPPEEYQSALLAGAGSEEQPSLTVSDYMSMFDEESPPEEYHSALLAGAGSEEQPSLTVSDYMSMFDEESPPEEYNSALLAGAGSEEQPSLTVSDYMSMFDEESPPEEYHSALLAGAGSEEQSSLSLSDYIAILMEEDYSLPEEYSSAALLAAATGQYRNQDLLLPAEGAGESSMVEGQTSGGRFQAERNMDHERSNKCIFRTQSAEEVLKDGYKWRKYGKKSVKNSPHKRNYYRCSAEGCGVKKRIERDREDPSYVLTAYEGKHCHPPPGEGYYSSVLVPAAGAPAGASSASAACASTAFS